MLRQCLPMSFSTKYLSDSIKTPYEDWVRYKRLHDAVFYFEYDRQQDTHIAMFWPSKNLIWFLGDYDRNTEHPYIFDVTIEISIDTSTSSVKVQKLFCSCHDNSFRHSTIPHGNGGVSHYKTLVDQYVAFSIQEVIELFFGKEWRVELPPSTTLPVAENVVEFAKKSIHRVFKEENDYGFVCFEPHILGHFNPVRDLAATTIQKYFRGWKARMKYAFNPHTRLGRFYALKLFRN